MSTMTVYAMIRFHLGTLRPPGSIDWRAPTAADRARGDVGWRRGFGW